MSFFGLLTLRDFLPNVFSRSALKDRLEQNRISALSVLVFGDESRSEIVTRKGKAWADADETAVQPEHSVIIITPKSVQCQARDVSPPLPGGNTEENLAEAVLEKQHLLRSAMIQADRRYQIVPYSNSRFSLFCSVREQDIAVAEMEAEKKGRPAVRAVIGPAAAFKVATMDLANRFPQATAVVICDQNCFIVAPVRNQLIDVSKIQMMIVKESESSSLAEAKDDLQTTITEQCADHEAESFVAVYQTKRSKVAELAVIPAHLTSEIYTISNAELCFA